MSGPAAADAPAPCAGIDVVEVALGCSDLGLGLAGGLPGLLLHDLGADVVRVVDPTPVPLDAAVPWGSVWHRDKRIVATDDVDEIRSLLVSADVALVYGAEATIEARGLGWRDLAAANPGLVHARCRPSRTGTGSMPDFGLLVEARSGFCTQLAGHRPGPIFVDVRAPGIGTASILTSSVLALLRRRALTGEGGWAETSLYDGMLATLGCMIGRSERAAPEIEGYWERGSTFPNFLYRCADDELIQVWFGGKGMYPALIQVLGDEPSEDGYYRDQMTGKLQERAVRWRSFFATEARDTWVERLRAAGVACEPVLAPGEVMADPHVLEIGLARVRREDGRREVTVGPQIAVTPLVGSVAAPVEVAAGDGRGDLLAGVRVVDFSAFVAGPLAAQVLGDLGADVIKVEPPGGEAMRAAAYAVAACQRGKRSVALDITAPEARPVVEALLDGADVVLHNFRVGVAERLGIDEATLAARNPGAVHCHASGFGTTGPRAKAPGNDALMQALSGFERAIGGAGNDPIAATWIPLDMAGGWVAALGILAGLNARARDGRGQRVVTSLLGAAMLLHSGVAEVDGELVPGPQLDGAQTGYGPGYRLYEGSDGAWFALVLPDEAAWGRLCSALSTMPAPVELDAAYTPLRCGPDAAAAEKAEAILEAAFAAAPAADWVARLAALDLLVEPVADVDRDQFRRGILDDPVNRSLGRVAAYDVEPWGHFEQIGPLLRTGPELADGPPLRLPQVGEHTVEVLTELGFDDASIRHLLDTGLAVQHRSPEASTG